MNLFTNLNVLHAIFGSLHFKTKNLALFINGLLDLSRYFVCNKNGLLQKKYFS